MKTKIRKDSGNRFVKIFGVMFIVGAITIITLFVLEKKGITNLYTRQDLSTTQTNNFPVDSEGNRLPNTVDYGPSKDEDTVPIPDKAISPIKQPATNSELTVVITNSRKSESLYLIKAVISGTDSASCSASMTKGSLSSAASSGANAIEGQYSCKDLSIPLSQLPEAGEWELTVTVTDKNGSTASTTEKVIL